MSAAAALLPGSAFARLWRSSTSRLLLTYGALFLAWSVVLVGVISWQTSSYLEGRVDRLVEQRASFLASVERARLPELLAATPALDPRGTTSFGLFDAAGRYLSGDIETLPAGLMPDGRIHALPQGVRRISGERSARTRGVALKLADGSVMVLARDYDFVDQLGTLIRDDFLWALSLIAVPGLLGGYLLGRGPLHRVLAIEAAIEPIRRGDLGARLPVSERHDELDMLATIVNRMLEEMERLLGEVKGVSDSIAHDLRTPLTRLRAQLHHLARDSGDAGTRGALLERCITDTDALLDRFRALLRISEIEDLQRRAGFRDVDVLETLRRAHELYAPLAEDHGLNLVLDTRPIPALHADPDLLFEALVNLISNGIKFTPTGGTVRLTARRDGAEVLIEVSDDGPGIAEEEREAVQQRFYRTQAGRQRPGFGLGLSIVAAVAKLHGYRFTIGAGEPHGARMQIHCPLPGTAHGP